MSKSNRYNLDVNATYGVDAEVWSFLRQELSDAGNPSSVHHSGQKAKSLIESARESILSFVGAGKSSRLIFTSGATEANNLALLSQFSSLSQSNAKKQVLISALEHPSVLEVASVLSDRGLSVIIFKPSVGSFSVSEFLEKVSEETRLVSLMLANNETGELFPVEKIVAAIRKRYPKVIIHCDAVQALGKIKFSFDHLDVDMMSVSGHKIGALPGIGALVAKRTIHIEPVIVGGSQELRFRAGTENLPGIVSFGYVIEKLRSSLDQRMEVMNRNCELLKSLLRKKVEGLVFHERIPNIGNTISLRVAGIRADDLVVALDLAGIMISSGSACASGKQDPSHVLLAMGFPESEVRETVRISLGHHYTPEEIFSISETMAEVISRMRSERTNREDSHVSY